MTAYFRPTALMDALALLKQHTDLVIIAGGTDIYPARAARVGWGDMRPQHMLDISGIRSLRGIEDRGNHWWIGALTTWADLARTPLPPLFDGLRAAAKEIGGAQIQATGTIGGNCCTASPAGDSIPCLLALDAEIEIMGDAAVCVPVEGFFTGYRTTALATGQLVTGIRVPKTSGHGGFLKLGARRYLVISIAMVAGVIACDAQGLVTTARLAVGACGPTATRLKALEAEMIGQKLAAFRVDATHVAHLQPIDDIRASASYRRHAAMVLTRDLIAQLAGHQVTDAAHG